MEFSDGNYGLLQSAFDYSKDVTAADGHRGAGTGTLADGKYEVRFTVQRGVVDLLHARRLHADDGLDRVEADRAPARCRCRCRLRRGRRSSGSPRTSRATSPRSGRRCSGPRPRPGTVGGTVPATLSLTLGTAPSFGAFTAGVAKDYFASSTITVTSSAGDAALIVQDTSPFHTNKLVNGTFALAQPVQVKNNAGVYQTMPAG